MPARGRIAQDTSFVIDGLCGSVIDKALLTQLNTADEARVIWLHLRGTPHWHRVFGDAGLLIWEEWDQGDAFADFDDFAITDAKDHLGISGAIASIGAVDGRLTIETSNGDVVIELTNRDGLWIRPVGSSER